MPLPKPRPGEEQNDFVSRCISFEKNASPDTPDDQVQAMCYEAWRNRGESFNEPPEPGSYRAIESVSFEGAKFNDETKVVNNVCLLSPVSRNGYRYTDEAMAKAIALYNGVQVYISHPTIEEMKTGRRDIMRLAGKVTTPRFESGKIRGDVVTLPDVHGQKFYDVAKTMPESVGCSHVADIDVTRDNGELLVESIKQVFSVDLVASPATNKNMFESQNVNRNQETEEMNYKEVKLEELRTARPDIVEKLIGEGKTSRDDEVKTLEAEKVEIEKKFDEISVKVAHSEKLAVVNKMITESKLPKEAITDTFRKTLLAIESTGAEFEKAAKVHIEDRMNLVGGVKNMGGSKGAGGGGGTKIDEDGAFDILLEPDDL